jgi:hypothetical protein
MAVEHSEVPLVPNDLKISLNKFYPSLIKFTYVCLDQRKIIEYTSSPESIIVTEEWLRPDTLLSDGPEGSPNIGRSTVIYELEMSSDTLF